MEGKTMKLHKIDDLMYYTFPSFDDYNSIKHCFTTRLGGVSEGHLASMNLGFGRGDSEENLLENYRIICNALGIDHRQLVISDQIHDAKIRVVTNEDVGKGLIHTKDYEGIDGLITDCIGIPLVTLYADCVPLFFFDPVQRVVGTAHAGWRGTVKQIGRVMVEAFAESFGSEHSDILVGIAPSIGNCCYEVDEKVKNQFEGMNIDIDDYIESKPNNKYHLNLQEINKMILINSGVPAKNITVTDLCTMCHKDVFFSHRGHEGKRGNMAAIIALV